jgi:hypothetical protein
VDGVGKASLSSVLPECLRDALYPPIGRRLGLDDKEARLGRLHHPFVISINAPQRKKENTHGKYDKLPRALALYPSHHPANFISLGGAFLLLPTCGLEGRRGLMQRKLRLDADAAPALVRFETQEPMARQRELAHLELALRYR